MIHEQFHAIRELLALRDLKRAEVQIAKLLREGLPTQDEAQVMALRARARLLAARPEEALDDIAAAERATTDEALKLELRELAGDSYFARFELASVGFADRAHVSRADDIYRTLIEEQPDYANVGWLHYQRGRIALTDARVDDAIAAFTAALLAPSPLPALTAYCFERLGFVAFYEQRTPRRALSLLDKALYSYPPSQDRVWLARLQTLRARVLRELGESSRALATIEDAISVAYANDDSKFALADALLTGAELLAGVGGRERDVITRVQQFLQIARKPLGIDVTWSRAYEMLGNASFGIGQYGMAGEAYQSALQYNPYHPWELQLHLQIARALYQNNEYERAILAVETLLKAAEKDGQPVSDYRVYDVLGSAHFALKQYRAALTAYDQALSLSPSAVDLDKLQRYRGFAAELVN
jgi:tetratricopeptide (TPR) repeat protein